MNGWSPNRNPTQRRELSCGGRDPLIRNQYPTLIGPARLGGVEHSEEFTADRHPRMAEGRPKA
jgi:hypothetical protein